MPASLDFKAIAENVDIEAVARLLGLTLRENRGPCPACQSSDQHALELLAESNSFRCWAADHRPDKKCLAGDCIGLYAHVKGYDGQYRAAKELAQHFGVGTVKTSPDRVTVPPVSQKRETREHSFDPDAFAKKLAYTDEIATMGLTEEEAKAAMIGVVRGVIHIPRTYASGAVAGWWKIVDGKLVPPAQWLPDTFNVTRFPKRA